MKARSGLVTFPVVAILLATLAAGSSAAGQSLDKQRGVSWVALQEIGPDVFEPLVEHNVGWIVQTPFGWQRGVAEPHVETVTSGRILWGETDEGLRVTTEIAQSLGIRTLLKPHVWVTEDDAWRGEISMRSEADWRAWFDSYRDFILHYARLARELDVAALAVGTELHRTVVERPDDWRALIADVRGVYDGELTYAANWYEEYEQVPFWDLLDYIGIQAYFPLAESDHPSVQELEAGWERHLPAISAVQERWNRPVLFTEAGYRSWEDAAARPWEWPERGSSGAIDVELQARLYEALFRTFWHRPWFAGVYWWKWYPFHDRVDDPNADFTPQHKPAARVMASWYER